MGNVFVIYDRTLCKNFARFHALNSREITLKRSTLFSIYWFEGGHYIALNVRKKDSTAAAVCVLCDEKEDATRAAA